MAQALEGRRIDHGASENRTCQVVVKKNTCKGNDKKVCLFWLFSEILKLVSLRHVVNNLFSIERYVVIFFHLLQVLDMESVWKFLQPSDLPHHWKASNG